jgi:hypothetical protein
LTEDWKEIKGELNVFIDLDKKKPNKFRTWIEENENVKRFFELHQINHIGHYNILDNKKLILTSLSVTMYVSQSECYC